MSRIKRRRIAWQTVRRDFFNVVAVLTGPIWVPPLLIASPFYRLWRRWTEIVEGPA